MVPWQIFFSESKPEAGKNFCQCHMRCRQNSIAAKWNIFLSFGLKVPFGFPCFAQVCLESWLGLVFFSTAYVTLVVALLFGGLVLLLAFLQVFFNRFLSLRCSNGHSSRGGSACMFLRMDGQCFWFCHSRVIAFSSRATHMLQILVVVQAVLVRMDRS